MSDPRALLSYFFGRGESAVRLELDGRPVNARLSTRWLGTERAWFAHTSALAQAAAPRRKESGAEEVGEAASVA